MEVYILNPSFTREEVVDRFVSFIWTERYSSAGDFSLSVVATPENIAKYKHGTFIATAGTKEVMIVDTAIIEKNILKVTGMSLTAFLANLIIRSSSNYLIKTWEFGGYPAGQLMAYLVYKTAVPSPDLFPDSTGVAISKQAIPNLSLGTWDTSGPNVAISFGFGELYATLKSMAETYALGMSLYLETASASGYSLKFRTYKGRDLTSTQSVNPVVRFSPALDSLTDVKELSSVSGFKNVAYAYASNFPFDAVSAPPGYAVANDTADASVGFNRKALHLFVDDIQYDENAPMSHASLKPLLDQRARDALANNNYTRVMDGEVVPQSEFKYKEHYFLGDIVELVGSERASQKARITEYIRTQDNTGERAYPTVSVIA